MIQLAKIQGVQQASVWVSSRLLHLDINTTKRCNGLPTACATLQLSSVAELNRSAAARDLNTHGSNMHEFEEYIYQRFAEVIRSWPPAVARDIYVIVIYISLLEDDSRFAELSLNYNTLSNYHERIADASNEAEAKWNYAFWPHDDKIRLCESPKSNPRHPDLEGIHLRDEYLRSRLPQYDLSDAESDLLLHNEDHSQFYRYESEIINAVVDVCGFVIRRLHEDGLIVQVCGHSVPVVVEMLNDSGHDEYRLAQVEAANPTDLANDYINWT